MIIKCDSCEIDMDEVHANLCEVCDLNLCDECFDAKHLECEEDND